MTTVLKKPELDAELEDSGAVDEELTTPVRGRRRGVSFWKKKKKDEPEPEEEFVPDSSQWSAGSHLATKAITVILGAALFCGPAALAYEVLRPTPPAVAASTGYDQRLMNRRDAAINFALGVVPTWLRADRTHTAGIATYWNVDQLSSQLPVTGAAVTDPRLYSATPSAPGVWSVVVSATVNGANTRRYFQLPVAVSGSTAPAAGALTFPSEIAAPGTGVNQSVQYDTQVDPSSQASATVTQFLQALLIGQGNITRYTRPGVAISAVSPPPWSAVSVQQLSTTGTGSDLVSAAAPLDGSVVRLLVTAGLTPIPSAAQPSSASASSAPSWPGAARTPAPTTSAQPSAVPTSGTDLGLVPVQYEISLTARAGRWEVSALDPAPVTSAPQQ